MRSCKRCGIPFGQATPGCGACYMRERYYKDNQGAVDRRKESSRAYYQATKDDPAKQALRTKWKREHPEQVKVRQRSHQKKQREKWRAILAQVKARPCMDCNNSFPPCAMDLHHRDPSLKLFSFGQFQKVSALPGMTREQTLRQEIAKCDLVCSNCHRVRHAVHD